MKIKGESGEQAQDSDSFASKPAWKRFVVLVAGVAMNLVLAAVLFSIGYMAGLPSIIDESLPSSARVESHEITVMQVVEGSPAAEAGVVSGDVIASIDGQVFTADTEARDYFATNAADGVDVLIYRSDESYTTYTLTSEYLQSVDTTGVGIAFVSTGLVSYPFFSAIGQGGFIQRISLPSRFSKHLAGSSPTS